MWNIFDGFISYGQLILIAGIILGTVLFERLVRYSLNYSFESYARRLKTDVTQFLLFKRLVSVLIYAVGIGIAIYMIPAWRSLAVSMFAGAGILAVVVGFASQQAFSNVVSGLLIVMFKPYRIGDRIRIRQDLMGIVEDITLRHTVIKDYENRRIVVPNSVINNEIIINESFGDARICKQVDFGISYDSDIGKAINIIQEEAGNHPDILDNRSPDEKKNKKPVVAVRVIELGDSSVNLRAFAWSKDPPIAYLLACDLRKSVKERFDKEGIEIPFPHRTIVYKKDLTKTAKKARSIRRARKKRRRTSSR